MTIAETIQLLKAGYTKSEIQEMKTAAETQSVLEDSAPAPEIPQEEKESSGIDYSAELSEIKTMMRNINSMLQKQNIRNSELPGNSADTAQDILASIINGKEK